MAIKPEFHGKIGNKVVNTNYKIANNKHHITKLLGGCL